MLCRIYEGTGPLDAWGVRDWVELHRIPAFVRWVATWPSVWVLEGDSEAARALMVWSPAPPGCPGCTASEDDCMCWMFEACTLP